MAQATILQMLPQTSYNSSSVVGGVLLGERQPAASYYLGNKDLQTVSWNLTTFTGYLTIQASLMDNPSNTSDSDWVTVATVALDNETRSGFQNINGNFVWLRLRVTGFTQGVIQNVKVSY